MGERSAFVTEETNLLVDKAVREKNKKLTSYAVNVFDGKLFVNVLSNFPCVAKKYLKDNTLHYTIPSI